MFILGWLLAKSCASKYPALFDVEMMLCPAWAAVCLDLAAAVLERAPLWSQYGLLGWATKDHWLRIAYLALVPGIVGMPAHPIIL